VFRKVAFGILGLVVLATALSVASHFWFASRVAEDDARLQATLSRTDFTAESLREDVSALRELLTSVHPAAIPSFPVGDFEPDMRAVEAVDWLEEATGKPVVTSNQALLWAALGELSMGADGVVCGVLFGRP